MLDQTTGLNMGVIKTQEKGNQFEEVVKGNKILR